MTITYSEYELLEFFEDFPKVVDDDAKIYNYSYRDATGHIFSVSIYTYEDAVVLSISHENLSAPIIEFTLEDVSEIKVDVDKEILTITVWGEPFVQVYRKPNISIRFLKLQPDL